ncbi:MAG: alpha amylase C-terminal domain-containing protein [Alistipes sp.]|nr:alpha amylase C-terminal domain-containing protein [Candidatus Minthomonas equi]
MFYDRDSYLAPYVGILRHRYESLMLSKEEMAGYGRGLSDSANNHLFYCAHLENGMMVFREWAPNATAIYLLGDCNGWRKDEDFRFGNIGNGNWELRVRENLLPHGALYKWWMEWPGGAGERIPAYATRCVQDEVTKLFCAQIWRPGKPYIWKSGYAAKVRNPFIYETHIGMSSEEEKVGTFVEFRRKVLPHIASLGYNVIQIMALQEHPYYGSFGYQVSNFFALSSRFGTPEEFKALVDDAHRRGMAVVMDVVHSHSVDNEAEGLSLFDGTDNTYFHSGDRGRHPAWKSRCFDYGSPVTRSFLLSNLKFWMEEYHLDGFRFDGVTSMIYRNHGLGKDFTDYSCYFDGNQDEDAIQYLALANMLVHELNPAAMTIAEDVSGLPGLGAPISDGGVGFDYRMSMGVADHWIKWIKERRDEDWSMGEIWWECSNKRKDERTVSYAECHDQAMVGDKTIIFRLMDSEMYTGMNLDSKNPAVDRGVALHKMIRLMTLASSGDGYLTFMGNEFGHPEWIDFPREGNGWSYKYARRQWSLCENPFLRYRPLMEFDRAMIKLFRRCNILAGEPVCLSADENSKILIFKRGKYIFALNFNSVKSFADYSVRVPAGRYEVVLDSDALCYGGFGRNDDNVRHFTEKVEMSDFLRLYLPCRSALVLKRN